MLGGRKGGCYDLVSDIGAIFIPVCVSAMQSIGAKDAVLATQEMCSACTVGDTEVAQAICELSTSICTQCSLAQLLYTVSAIFSAVHGKYKKSPDLHTLQAVVRIIENCAPLLRSLAASAEIRRFSSIELDAVCSLILSCRIELLLPAFSLKAESAAEMSSFAPQAVGALQRVYDTYSLLLQNILRKAGRAELVLPAASSIVR